MPIQEIGDRTLGGMGAQIDDGPRELANPIKTTDGADTQILRARE